MRRPSIEWHPANWPWPQEKTRDYASQLGRRARDLISRDGFFIRDLNDNLICQKTQVGGWHLTLWLKSGPRIEVVRDNKLVLKFSAAGLETVDSPLCKDAVREITKAEVLQDLADA